MPTRRASPPFPLGGSAPFPSRLTPYTMTKRKRGVQCTFLLTNEQYELLMEAVNTIIEDMNAMAIDSNDYGDTRRAVGYVNKRDAAVAMRTTILRGVKKC